MRKKKRRLRNAHGGVVIRQSYVIATQRKARAKRRHPEQIHIRSKIARPTLKVHARIVKRASR